MPNFVGLTVWSLGSIFDQVLDLYFYAIIAYVIITWFAQLQQNPMMEVLTIITYPLTSLGRRVVPLIGGIDLSPILLIFSIKLVSILLATPLIRYGLLLSQ